MRCTVKSLALLSMLFASAVTSLAAQSRMRLGDEWPSTDLTPAQRTFGERYIAAINGTDVEAYKKLLHPSTRPCLNKDNAEFFGPIFNRRVNRAATNAKLSIEKLPEKFGMVDALAAKGYLYSPAPTHAFHIDFISAPAKDVSIVAFVVQDKGVWYEILPCPSAAALAERKKRG
jgi:hypothetical protein